MATTDRDLGSHCCPKCGHDQIQGFVQAAKIEPGSLRTIDLSLCNDPPRESEIPDILERKAIHVRMLSKLDEQIQATRNALELLDNQRDSVVQEVDKMNGMLSPLRRLPADILGEIFLACREKHSPHTFLETNSLDTRDFPWVLVRVCSRWRSVGNSLRALWSSISINLDAAPLTDASAFLLDLCIQLSGKTLLSVQLRAKSFDIPPGWEPLQTLLSSSYRWKSVVLELTPASIPSLSSLHGALDSLRVLDLQIEYDGSDDLDVQASNVFEIAPHLHIVRAAVEDISSRFSIPWHQLSEYLYLYTDYNGVHAFPQHLDILRRTPDIQKCDLDCGAETEYTGQIITLTKLRGLYLVEKEFEGIAALVRHLALPALDDMDLEGDWVDVNPILSLLDRSQCRLTELTLRMPYLTADDLIRLLHCVPSVQQLSVREGSCFNDEVVNRLAFRPIEGGLPLLPSLLRLELDELSCDAELLVEMFESRCLDADTMATLEQKQNHRLAPMESLTFCDNVDFPPHLLSRLGDCSSPVKVLVGVRLP